MKKNALLDASLIAQLDHLELVVRRLFAGRTQGEKRSKRRGTGSEFADYRDYAQSVLPDVQQNIHEAASLQVESFIPLLDRWRAELGGYLRPLPGGEQKASTMSRIDLIFRSRLVSAIAGRIFLYGEPLSAKTLVKALTR